MPSEIEIAWAAGLFEGEGCISLRKAPASKQSDMSRPGVRKWNRMPVPYNGWGQATVALGMTDRDVVERFAAIMGGDIRVRVQVSKLPNHKPMYRWTKTNNEFALGVYQMFKPYLGERRLAKFQEVFSATRLLTCENIAV